MDETIYEDKFYKVIQTKDYPNIPGCYTIVEKEFYDNFTVEKSKTLALLEKKIRKQLLDLGIELVGIYKQEENEGLLNVIIIPYHLDRLEELDISPDGYQPYIEEYLNSYNNGDNYKAKSYAKKTKKYLEKR